MENNRLNIQESCEYLGIGRTSLFALLKRGELQRVMLGKKTFVTKESLINFNNKLLTNGSERLNLILLKSIKKLLMLK